MMPRRGQDVPSRYLGFTMSLAVLAGVGAVASWIAAPPEGGTALLLLVVGAIVAEALAVALPSGATTSLAFPLTVATIISLGPSGALLVALASAVGPRDLRAGRSPVVAIFNVGQIVLVSVSAAWIYRITSAALAGYLPFRAALALAVLACVVAATAGNDALVAMGIHLKSGTPLSEIWYSGIKWMIPTQLALASVGVLMAWSVNASAWTLPLFAVPLVIAQSVFSRSGECGVALRDTVRALVGLVEAKDPYTAGHSERVAEYSRRLGAAVGLTRTQLDKLELAALLHDLGKVGISTALLNAPRALTRVELADIRRHPMIGADYVTDIPGLRDLGGAIAHHHERFDGEGYGGGLRGDTIPLNARILAVADAYDAMTSSRSYRSRLTERAALAEIAEGAGAQFDPSIAAAFLDMHVGREHAC